MSMGLYHTIICTTKNEIFCFLQNLNFKPEIVQGSDKIGEIIDIKSGNNSSIVLTSEKTVYKIDHNNN